MGLSHPPAAGRTSEPGVSRPQDGLWPHSAESRIFDTDDMDRLRHGVAAALQALGFAVDGTNVDPFVISGSRVAGRVRRLTVYLSLREEAQSIVRVETEPLDQDAGEPPLSGRFFDALSRAMYLTGHDV